jgi:hypothetical protein
VSDTLKLLGQGVLGKLNPLAQKGAWFTSVNGYAGKGNANTKVQGVSYSSCNTTMHVLAEVVDPQFLQAVPGAVLMNAKPLRAKLMALLDEANFLMVQTGPNHHFVVFPVGKDVVSILQGFQGVYDYTEWRQYRGEGLMHRVSFIDALIDFRFGSGDKGVEAAVDLFSFRLGRTTGSNATIQHAPNAGGAVGISIGVEQEIRRYYRNIRSISAIQYGRIIA